MRSALIALIFCAMAAQPGHAGAWLREVGTGFVSVTTTLWLKDDAWRLENSLYADYGVGPGLTLGVDINDSAGVAGHALVFLRVPVNPGLRRINLALELGLGGHHRQGQWDGMIKSTFSLGRGFPSRWGSGWFNVDTGLELRLPNRNPAFKLDAIIGLSSGPRIRPILQLESTYISSRPLIWSVIPGALIDGRNNTTWLIGLSRKTAGQSSLGLKIGLWRRF